MGDLPFENYGIDLFVGGRCRSVPIRGFAAFPFFDGEVALGQGFRLRAKGIPAAGRLSPAPMPMHGKIRC